jgi:PAS domain S-box-containing protein
MRQPTDQTEPEQGRRRSAARKSGDGTHGADGSPRLPEVLGDAHFLRFAESSNDVFWLADLDSGALVYCSPRFEALWGVDVRRLLREPACWNAAVLPSDAGDLPRPFFDERPGASDKVREYRIASRGGQVRWIRDRRFELRDGGSGRLCVGGIAEDVTESKQRDLETQALLQREREARAQAEAAALTKDEFLAVVTHELRSPLNAIRGWSHVLRHSGDLSAPQIKALDAIDRNTQTQAHLVDDLLDSQRILCGKFELQLGRIPLAHLIDEALDVVRPTAQAKRIRLEAIHDWQIGLIKSDPDRLRQALVKLLSNAVKFTPEDGIVAVRSRRTTDGLVIDVEDTGVGLSAEQIPRVFGPFQQADSSNTRRANGLGLSLARQLVELHGGKVTVASRGAGCGSTFTIELPGDAICADAAVAAPEMSLSPLAGKRIVIVEDDDDGREVLGLILRGAQVRLQSFDRTAAAFEFIAHAGADEQPDALISDIAMPDEDGYAFIRRVRELEGGEHRPHVAALALTSFARVEDRLRALRAGFDAHVAKPIDPERVLCTLMEVLGLPDDKAAVSAA